MKKVQQEFGVSEYLARQSKKLIEERVKMSAYSKTTGFEQFERHVL